MSTHVMQSLSDLIKQQATKQPGSISSRTQSATATTLPGAQLDTAVKLGKQLKGFSLNGDEKECELLTKLDVEVEALMRKGLPEHVKEISKP
jgi:hypothetical protein